MKDKADIIVVGGGPCGSLAAFTAAKLGANVLVFEEHKEIGVPKHCAGHLSLSGLKRLGLHLPDRIVENEFKNAIFHSPSGKKFVVRCQSPVTCVVNRELFDKHLSNLAMKAGADYQLRSRVESFVLDSDIVTGVAVTKGIAQRTLTSNVVIDAEGFSSGLLRRTRLQTLDRSMIVKAIQIETTRVVDIDEDTVEVYLGANFAPGFFAWIIPRKDGSAKVGLATKIGDPRKYLQRFMRSHPVASEKLRRSKITEPSLHPISLGGPIPQTFSGGLLVVGDAASQVKPTTGGGLILGLSSSQIAGQVAYNALMTTDVSATFLSQYQARWKKVIGFDLTFMQRARKILNRLSDEKLDKFIELCAKLKVNNILQEAGDLDFQGMSLVHMMKHPSILATLLFFLCFSMTISPISSHSN